MFDFVAADGRIVPRSPRYTHGRSRARFACALLVACALATSAWAAGLAGGASSNVVVSIDVPSSTTLSTTGCAPYTANVTMFGTVQPGGVAKTQNDCSVSFGSSNDSSSLRMVQSDGTGTAMTHPTDTWTRHGGGASRVFNVDGISNVIWAGSANGLAIRSVDTGANWATKDVNGAGSANLGSISTPTTSAAWLAGDGEVWRTTQSDLACAVAAVGACWSNVSVDGARAVAAVDANIAWTVGAWSISPTGAADPGNAFLDSNIYYTSNGGGLWTAQATPMGSDLGALRIFDSNTLVAWRNNGTGAVATHDGSTWRDIAAPNFINDLYAFDDNTMVAVSNLGITYRTTNAMAATPTWTLIPSGQSDNLTDLSCSPTMCIATGERGAQARSTDGGLSWTPGDADTSLPMSGITRIGATTYVAGSAGDNMFVTTNDGVDWTQTRTGNTAWNDITHVPGTRYAWRVGNDGAIDRSSDNGFSWSNQVAPLTTANELLAVHAFDELRVVAVGRNGTIRRTSNGGTSWTTVTSPTAQQLNAVDGTGSGFAWVAGNGGIVLGTGDFGATWTLQHTLAGRDYKSVIAFGNSTAVVGGVTHAAGGGAAARTTDGRTWSTFVPPNSSNAITAAAGAAGTDVGTFLINAGLYRTTDAGATWNVIAAPGSYNSYRTITMPDPSTVYLGSLGGIRRSLDGGATSSAISVNFHNVLAIAAFDRVRIATVGDGATYGTTNFTGTVNDYVMNTSDWYDHGTEAFGACLRSTTATPTWTPNATCDQTADGGHWNGISSVSDSSAEVATTAAGDGTRVANFRFGIRVAPDEPPGELSAGITFVLIAPDA